MAIAVAVARPKNQELYDKAHIARTSRRTLAQKHGNSRNKSYEQIAESPSCLISKNTPLPKAMRIAKLICRIFYGCNVVANPIHEWNQTYKNEIKELLDSEEGGDERRFLRMISELREKSYTFSEKLQVYAGMATEEKVRPSTEKKHIIEDQAALLVDLVMSSSVIHSIHSVNRVENNGQLVLQLITNPIILIDTQNANQEVTTPALHWDIYSNSNLPCTTGSVKERSLFHMMEMEKAAWKWQPAASRRPHPHVEGNYLCHGHGAGPASKAINRGELATYLRVIEAVVSNYNPQSPYMALRDYIKPDLAKCVRCENERRRNEMYTHMVAGNIAMGGKTANLCSDCAITVTIKEAKKKAIARVDEVCHGLYEEGTLLKTEVKNPLWFGNGTPYYISDELMEELEIFELYSEKHKMVVKFTYNRNQRAPRMTRNASIFYVILAIDGITMASSGEFKSKYSTFTQGQNYTGAEAINKAFAPWINNYSKNAVPHPGVIVRDEESQARFLSAKPA